MDLLVEAKGRFNTLHIRSKKDDGTFHRHMKKPGDDFSGEPQAVLDARDQYHTPEIVAAYLDHIATAEAERVERELGPHGKRRMGKPREFLHLFTDTEKAAFFLAKQANVQLELWWAEASTGDFSLDHPTVALGLASLVQAGILTQVRADEIKDADFNDVS